MFMDSTNLGQKVFDKSSIFIEQVQYISEFLVTIIMFNFYNPP